MRSSGLGVLSNSVPVSLYPKSETLSRVSANGFSGLGVFGLLQGLRGSLIRKVCGARATRTHETVKNE